MLIRTQDRKCLVDMTQTQINVYELDERYKNDKESYEIVLYSDFLGCNKQLGTYSTEDKAMKVLDMIQGTYLSANCQYAHNAVFEMPADEEV